MDVIETLIELRLMNINAYTLYGGVDNYIAMMKTNDALDNRYC